MRRRIFLTFSTGLLISLVSVSAYADDTGLGLDGEVTASPADVRDAAEAAVSDYDGVEYARVRNADGTTPDGSADCSSFVRDVENRAGNDVGNVATYQMPASPEYVRVPNEEAEPGDVILSPSPDGVSSGHMGIYDGADDRDRPLGYQMGKHGSAEIPFKGAVEFYRPATTQDLEARIGDQLDELVSTPETGDTPETGEVDVGATEPYAAPYTAAPVPTPVYTPPPSAAPSARTSTCGGRGPCAGAAR